jgi:hypothetical protein
MLLIDVSKADIKDVHDYYDNVEHITTLNVHHSMPEEHKHIYFLRGRKPAHPITWQKIFD